MSNSELIRSLVNVIGIDLELDKAIKDVVLGLLELPEEPEPKKEPAKRGRPKKTEEKKTEPKKSEPKPFDTGKLKALLNGGWSVAKIADEMGVSVQTIYNKMKTEGITNRGSKI